MIKRFETRPLTPLEHVAQKHTSLMNEHPNMYFELASTRMTGACAWLTTEDVEDNVSREVIGMTGGDDLVDAVAEISGNSSDELDVLKELTEYYENVVNAYPYAYFIFYAKPKEGWVLKISTHTKVTDDNFKLLVSVTTDNMYDTLSKGLEQALASNYER
jgi:hypothetical protein